jgi:hypothetical protein
MCSSKMIQCEQSQSVHVQNFVDKARTTGPSSVKLIIALIIANILKVEGVLRLIKLKI